VGCEFWWLSWLALWVSAGWLERTVGSFVIFYSVEGLAECVGMLMILADFVCAVFQLNGCFVLWFFELFGH